MANKITIPVKHVGGDRWGDLCAFGQAHEICGEAVRQKSENFSFSGGHRVRLYSFKKNVHWKIPAGVTLDISEVTPARRLQR